jgi:hypothetical protein
METISLKLIDKDLHISLLPRLEGTVFHLTTQGAYRQIEEDGKIKHNKNKKFPLNTGSENSYGINHGYICLFNLKEKDKETINDTLLVYFFLEPFWFRKYYNNRTESKLVYLILDSKFHHLIIDSEKAKGSPYQHVPKTECWIDNHIPLDYIEKAFIVDIINSAPKEPFSLAHHMLILEKQKKQQITKL